MSYESFYQELDGVDIPPIDSEWIAAKTITPTHTTFMGASTNLLNEQELVKGVAISSSTGEENDDEDYTASPFIAVQGSEEYTFNAFNRILFYDDNQDLITVENVSGVGEGNTVTAPSGCSYIRVHGLTASIKSYPPQINRGNTLLNYEPYYISLEGLKVDGGKEGKPVISIGSSNVYNPRMNTKGYSINSTTGKLQDQDGYEVSDFIKVDKNESYTFLGFARVVFYDASKQFISSEDVSYNPETTLTAPKNAYFLRVHTQSDYTTSEQQINAGDTLLDFEPFSVDVGGINIANDVEHPSQQGQAYYFPPEPIAGEYVALEAEYTTLTVSELESAYDDLITNHPDYISKTLLGPDSSGNYDIYQYHLKPSELDNEALDRKLPKIILQASIHGHERPSSAALYYMVKSICEDWQNDSLLEYLRFNVEFVFIAVLNPHGYESGDYKNANGINIQTNYPVNFREMSDPEDKSYGGEEPLSEVETQYSKAMIDDHSDALYFIDLHANDEMDYLDDYSKMMYVLVPLDYSFTEDVGLCASHAIKKMSRFIPKHYNVANDLGFLGWIRTRGEGPGTPDAYTGSLGIPTSIHEHFFRLPDGEANSSDSIKANEEFLTNYILGVLNHYKDIYYR